MKRLFGIFVLTPADQRLVIFVVLLLVAGACYKRHAPERLRVLVAGLRKKIELDPSRPELIVTEPWVGYRMTEA